MATNRYTTRRTVARELSDDAKIAKIRAFAGEEIANNLLEKYGPYAYDLYKKALSAPAYLVPYTTDGKFRSSKETLKHFAQNDLSDEQLAKIFNTSKAAVEAKKASYRTEHTQSEEIIPEKQSLHIVLSTESTNNFNLRVDDRKPAEPTQPIKEETNVAETTAETSQEATQTSPARDVSSMSLDDYAKNYKPEDRPLKGQAFLDAAYEDFGKGEGNTSKIIVEQPNHGSPTIGKGLVILPRQLLDPSIPAAQKKKYGNLPGYKELFKQMELTKVVGGKNVPLTVAEKGKIFDDLANAVKNNTLRTKKDENGNNVIISPASAAQVRMSQASIRKQYDKIIGDVMNRCYTGLGQGNKAQGEEIFNKYPRDLQFALAHAYYAGNPGLNISKAIAAGKVNPENPVDVLTRLAEERIVGNEQALRKLAEMNPEVFTAEKQRELKKKYNEGRNKSNSPRAPIVDALQMGEAADSLKTAQQAFALEPIEKKQTIRVAALNFGRNEM